MRNEPVRGGLPEPSFYSMSGLEQLRAFLHGRAVATPHARLLGYRLTQASAGNVVFNQPVSPWFDVYDGFVDLTATAEVGIFGAALTTAPAGVYVRVVNLSLRYLRPCTVDSDSVIARGRVLHAGSNVTTVETVMEDALGRVVAHATGSAVLERMEPQPPALAAPLEPVEEPHYPTPDPPRRPLDHQSAIGVSPFGRFLGVHREGDASGAELSTMRTSEWFCNAYREVSPGMIGALAAVVGSGSIGTSIPDEDERVVTINFTYSFLAPVLPDGRELRAAAKLRGRRGDAFVLDVEIDDADDRAVLVGQATCLLRGVHSASGRRAERLLLTVMFIDIVGSTEHVTKLGDEGWRERLDAYRALVRRALETHKGREVKTIGDGFLVTFDSPTRAVRCADEIRTGVESLGLALRAGVHTGECDLVAGDVGGLAVHVAARLESAAAPGEIVVSRVVRDLTAASGTSLVERGAQELKGVDGMWELFVVE